MLVIMRWPAKHVLCDEVRARKGDDNEIFSPGLTENGPDSFLRVVELQPW